MATSEIEGEDEVARLRDLDHSGLRRERGAHPPAPTELSQRIAGLIHLTSQQLREEWRRLYRSQPPRLSRDLLIRTIAYRMQELAFGGPARRHGESCRP